MAESILVVDDEQSIRDILTEWLQGAGYCTFSASNGLEGLNTLYHQHPDLVITDILMPQIDGYEMCSLIRQISGTPIMVVTTLDKETARVKGLRAGADDFVVKPVNMQSFLSRVSSLLHRNRGANRPPTVDRFPA